LPSRLANNTFYVFSTRDGREFGEIMKQKTRWDYSNVI